MNNRGYQNKRPNFRHNNTRKNYHGNNNNNPNNGRDYGNHDDRGADNYNSHGSLGPPGMQHRIRNNNNPNNSSNIPRNNSSRFRNDQRNDGRFNDNRNDNMRIDNRRAGGPRPGQGGRRNAIPNKDYDDNELGWFKVTIPEGKTMTRDQILSEFHSKQVMPFVAYNFNVDMNGANFFVQGGQVVSSLRSFNKRLKSPTGESLTVRSNRTQKPSISVDDKLTEQTKIIMSRRYNVPEKALDLTNFAEDPAFKESCIFLVISRPEILGMICEIIKNNIPELVSINFCRNDIYTLQPLKTIAETCPGVKSLNISQNKVGVNCTT